MKHTELKVEDIGEDDELLFDTDLKSISEISMNKYREGAESEMDEIIEVTKVRGKCICICMKFVDSIKLIYTIDLLLFTNAFSVIASTE